MMPEEYTPIFRKNIIVEQKLNKKYISEKGLLYLGQFHLLCTIKIISILEISRSFIFSHILCEMIV